MTYSNGLGIAYSYWTDAFSEKFESSQSVFMDYLEK
jgi:hypothetical protein